MYYQNTSRLTLIMYLYMILILMQFDETENYFKLMLNFLYMIIMLVNFMCLGIGHGQISCIVAKMA